MFLGFEKIRTKVVDTIVLKNKVVLTEDWYMLCQQVSMKEINEALWNIKDDKSPRLDGYNSYFLKKTWRIVGREVYEAVKIFFSNGKILK